jgi:cell wall-associated NlpC family hydrolase
MAAGKMRFHALLAGVIFLHADVLAEEMRPADVIQEIPFYALSLIGTPYKFGGNRPETGMDCSGFVNHVYREVAGIQLPRSSYEMSLHGEPLEHAELQPGDLVFFNTLNQRFSHVGVYVGDQRFIHATSSLSGSVMVSDMTQRYWSERFDGGRRLIVPPDRTSLVQP